MPVIAARKQRETPLLYQPAMVRATLAGLKTETRRLRGLDFINGRPGDWEFVGWQDGYPDGRQRAVFRHSPARVDTIGLLCPWGEGGDRIWPRETWAVGHHWDHVAPSRIPLIKLPGQRHAAEVHYLADGPKPEWAGKTRVSIHMPRQASRLLLELLGVGVERVQGISEESARAEGLTKLSKDDGRTWKYGIPDRDGLPGDDDDGWHWHEWSVDPRTSFARLWCSIHGDESWTANPWVWVLRFRLLSPTATNPKGP